MTQAPYDDIRRALVDATPEIREGQTSRVGIESLLRAGYAGQRPRAKREPHYEADAILLELLCNNAGQLLADAQLGALVRAAAGDTVEVVARAIMVAARGLNAVTETGAGWHAWRKDAEAVLLALRNLADTKEN